MKIGQAVTVLATTALLAACGGPQPPDAYPSNGSRVFETYRQTGTTTVDVTIPPGTRTLHLQMDCIHGSGAVRVSVNAAYGEIPCDSTAEKPTGGGVSLGRSNRHPWGHGDTITVTAPKGAHWSAAVDASEIPME